MSKFVIVTDMISAAAQNALSEAIAETVDLWWHHFPLTWLVVDEGGGLAKEDLAELIDQSVRCNYMVFEVEEIPYWIARVGDKAADWLDAYFRE